MFTKIKTLYMSNKKHKKIFTIYLTFQQGGEKLSPQTKNDSALASREPKGCGPMKWLTFSTWDDKWVHRVFTSMIQMSNIMSVYINGPNTIWSTICALTYLLIVTIMIVIFTFCFLWPFSCLTIITMYGTNLAVPSFVIFGFTCQFAWTFDHFFSFFFIAWLN